MNDIFYLKKKHSSESRYVYHLTYISAMNSVHRALTVLMSRALTYR